ncbi:Na+/H+ antiporter NhaC family protein [Halopelagius longus]|uniref:Na+/H+ antiporter NhaC family protein n=1 Tax=Halopelagius longus TaxID=1236180 RepID=A0A1H1AH53_9EURY|nr:Na+/H+ antiporter NhaC family protein [Halopelagius longus]RDI70376.1 Na+/H+ antiporter NhaC family protein [Halopelagius longus]SDQ38950.1 transporter, NhaC family [Halopelagius longus]
MPAENYGIISLLPALFAIVLTLVSRQVLLSLFAGIWIGATILVGWNPIAGAAHALQLVIDNITPAFNIKLLLFTFLSGAMLGMIFLSGGMNALAERIISRIKTRKQAEIGTSVLGMLIFVDSYASTMITGSVMRPITDKFDISREKLAYLLDSTTSPVVSIAVVSTWVGFEVGLISQQFKELGIEMSPFVVFLQSIPYRFYSLLAIALVFVVVFTGWNFGPMKRAEKRAKETGKVLRDDADPLLETREEDIVTPDHVDARWWYFAAPIVALVAVTGFGLLYSGGWPGVAPVDALKEAATADAILWGVFSACGLLLAILVGHARVALDDVSDAIFEGFKMVMFPVAVLSLAWTIGAVSQALGVGPYVVAVAQGIITANMLPAIVFVSAAIISFSIGTSWGTMGIMFPVAVPLAYQLGAPLPGAIGAILTGSLFGDHCSPISDTTVLSSMFAGADHVDHVNTQIPYALVAGGTATLLFLASGYGVSPLPLLAAGAVVVVAAAYTFSELTGFAVPRVFSSDAD